MRYLDDVIPEFVAKRPQRYRGRRLRDLCADMHAFYREADVSALQKAQFTPEHLPEMVDVAARRRQAADAQQRRLSCRSTRSRDASRPRLFVVYPPGIATIVPGERLDARARPMIDYLKAFERASNLFPGFEAEIQGLYREAQPDGKVRFYTYVVREERRLIGARRRAIAAPP